MIHKILVSRSSSIVKRNLDAIATVIAEALVGGSTISTEAVASSSIIIALDSPSTSLTL